MWLENRLTSKIIGWLTKERPPAESPPCDFKKLKNELKLCDVLLIEGHSRISNVIRSITQSPWTHAALYIGRLYDIDDPQLREIVLKQIGPQEKNIRLVVEGLLGKGTIVTPLSHYRPFHIRICRPTGLSPEDAQLVIQYAIKALGRPYSLRHLLDLARFLLPWSIMPRRWGSSLFCNSFGEPESGICTSLIAEAFSSVKFPILPYIKSDEIKVEMIHRNPHLFAPKDFDYSPYFDIIKYPLLPEEEQKPYYRRLPWVDNALYHDKGIVQELKKKDDGK